MELDDERTVSGDCRSDLIFSTGSAGSTTTADDVEVDERER